VVQVLAFSPDGATLATGGLRVVTLWDVATGEHRLKVSHPNFVFAVALSPKGDLLATGGADPEGIIRLIDPSSQELVARLAGHKGTVWGLAFSPDGSTLASASHDATVKLWDVAARRERATLRGQADRADGDAVLAVAFRPDGKVLASGGWGKDVRLWDPATGERLAQLAGHVSAVTSLAFAPDGRGLVSGSQDATAKLWDPAARAERAALGPVRAWGLAFAPDGRTLAATWGTAVRLWDAATGRTRAVLPGHTRAALCLAFSPDGRLLATGDGEHPDYATDDRPLGTRNAAVRLWDRGTGAVRHTYDADLRGIYAVAFSPDGATLAVGAHGGSVRLLDVAGGRERLRLATHQQGHVLSVAFSPDGRTLAAGCGTRWVNVPGEIVLWDAATGRELAMLDEQAGGHAGPVRAVAFAPDGRTLASAGGDQVIRLWDLPGRKVRTVLLGHTKAVVGLAYSLDGGRLASVSYDGTLRLWDAATGQELAALRNAAHVLHAVAFAPDGRALATGSGSADPAGGVRVWRADGAGSARNAPRRSAVTRASGQQVSD
jgi:WD40 repeat protein